MARHTLLSSPPSGAIVLVQSHAYNMGCTSELPVMVMSTDNGSEVSFEDWHDSADAYDDEGDEANTNLTSYKFLLEIRRVKNWE